MIEVSLQSIVESATEARTEERIEAGLMCATNDGLLTEEASDLEHIRHCVEEPGIYGPEAWDRFFTELHEAANHDPGDYETDPPAALSTGVDYLQDRIQGLDSGQTDSINPLVMRAAPMAGRCSTHSLNSLG